MKITVIMSTFNGEKYLLKQLESLRKQDRYIDEVLIGDDCSSDSTPQIINKYIKDWSLSNWTFIENKKNIGWILNFHKLLEKSTGDVVFFCDQDDIWYPNKVSEMINVYLSLSKVDVLTCGVDLIDANEKFIQNKKMKFSSTNTKKIIKEPFNKRYTYSIYPGCTMMINKNIINLLKNNQNSKSIPHDALYWKTGVLLGTAFHIDESLIGYRIHSNNASNPSASMKKKIKSMHIRQKEVSYTIKQLEELYNIYTELDFNNNEVSLIRSLISFENFRLNFLKSKVNIFEIYKYVHYYSGYKMLIGDILSRLKG